MLPALQMNSMAGWQQADMAVPAPAPCCIPRPVSCFLQVDTLAGMQRAALTPCLALAPSAPLSHKSRPPSACPAGGHASLHAASSLVARGSPGARGRPAWPLCALHHRPGMLMLHLPCPAGGRFGRHAASTLRARGSPAQPRPGADPGPVLQPVPGATPPGILSAPPRAHL